MRVIELHAENFKRLRAVDITPDEHVQVVAGRNAQGKTSLIDAIWHALAGGAASRSTARPIRDGEEDAEVTVNLGDLIVTRKWQQDGKGSLRVETADGARYKAPQQQLDTLLGALSFDPLEFAQQSPREQVTTLLELVELDFDPVKLDDERRGIFERRTDVNRRVRDLEGRLRDCDRPNPDLPDEEVSVSKLVAELDAARRAVAAVNTAADYMRDCDSRVADLEERLSAAKNVQETAHAAYAELSTQPLPDLKAIERKVNEADDTNVAVRGQKKRAQVKADLQQANADADELSRELAMLDKIKTDGLAKATMPLPGLSFDQDGVTYQGVPFGQASAAEQLRVSMAMAMTLNPEVRVILIRDGSLLDSENMEVVGDMARANDFQVWIERVDESGGVGVVIEDGQVKKP